MSDGEKNSNLGAGAPKSPDTGALKLGDLKTHEQVLAEELEDPEFRAEWERTVLARAVGIWVLKNGHQQQHTPDHPVENSIQSGCWMR